MRICTLLLICTFSSGMVCAQEKDSTKVKKKEKPTARDFIPTGVRGGIDVISLGRGHFKEGFSGFEVSGDIDFYRYLLAVDVGGWSNDILSVTNWAGKVPLDTSTYSNNGTYYRVGIDVNFLKKDPDKNILFIGFRKGRSVFSETLNAMVRDEVWGKVSQTYENDNVVGKWNELTFGLKVKMWKILWMGYTARFKFGVKTSDTPTMMPHDVPGYGRTDKTSYWGFNYLIMVRLPIRKQK